MKNYRVKLLASGNLTQIPDSQKIFGALTYMFSEQYGSQETTELTRDILKQEISIRLSDALPTGYLPVPQEYLVDCLSEGELTKEMRAAIKERKYIAFNSLQNVLDKPSDSTNILPYVSIRNGQQPRSSIESLKYELPELESKLYSVPTIRVIGYTSNSNDIDAGKIVKEYDFYLQIDNNKYTTKYLEMLEMAVKENQTIILGKRASQGLNVFQFQGIEELELPKEYTKDYLNLGMMLPNSIEFMYSTLKLFTSERRPYDVPGGWVKSSNRKFISFISQGSVIHTDNFDSAVKCIPSCFNSSRDIVFGNAFLYPIYLPERRSQDAKI